MPELASADSASDSDSDRRSQVENCRSSNRDDRLPIPNKMVLRVDLFIQYNSRTLLIRNHTPAAERSCVSRPRARPRAPRRTFCKGIFDYTRTYSYVSTVSLVIGANTYTTCTVYSTYSILLINRNCRGPSQYISHNLKGFSFAFSFDDMV